jgi:hypothetical protein
MEVLALHGGNATVGIQIGGNPTGLYLQRYTQSEETGLRMPPAHVRRSMQNEEPRIF